MVLVTRMKKMNRKRIVLACLSALSALLPVACFEGGTGGDLLESKGLPCELIVVCDETLRKCGVNDSILAITEGPVPGLGANEMVFRSTQLSTPQYIPAFGMMHSQVFFRLNKKLEEGQVRVAYDTKARPQIMVTVEAPSAEAMGDLLEKRGKEVQQLIYDFQVRRLARVARGNPSERVDKELRAVAGYSVSVPAELRATKCGTDFLWAGTNRVQEDMNFLFYTFPWDEAETNPVGRFVEQRDSVLKKNVPGSRPTQWMTTAKGRDGEPVVWARPVTLKGRRLTEVRGLWELHDGFMGGPFVALADVDSVNRRVVVAEGFVYNPQGQKRDLMRRMEGALQTLKKVK